jgi:hypothetical protein
MRWNASVKVGGFNCLISQLRATQSFYIEEEEISLRRKQMMLLSINTRRVLMFLLSAPNDGGLAAGT